MNARQNRDSNHNAARVARIKAQAIGKPCPYQEQRDKQKARPAAWIGLDIATAQPITAEDKYQKAHALEGKLLTVITWVLCGVALTTIAGVCGFLYQTYWVQS